MIFQNVVACVFIHWFFFTYFSNKQSKNEKKNWVQNQNILISQHRLKGRHILSCYRVCEEKRMDHTVYETNLIQFNVEWTSSDCDFPKYWKIEDYTAMLWLIKRSCDSIPVHACTKKKNRVRELIMVLSRQVTVCIVVFFSNRISTSYFFCRKWIISL